MSATSNTLRLSAGEDSLPPLVPVDLSILRRYVGPRPLGVEPVGVNLVIRDYSQAVLGTDPLAQELIAAHPNASKVGYASIQATGGTFFHLFMQKGRDEWRENDIMCRAFPGQIITALWRNDCGLYYVPCDAATTRRSVLAFAKTGVNVLTDFHGLNDAATMVEVPKAAEMARDLGYNIYAQGAICFEDNRNVTLDQVLRTAERLVETGHTGFYAKFASGKGNPDFTFRAIEKLLQNFDQQITVHTHDTYALAMRNYMAAVEAGAHFLDAQPHVWGSGTGHPSALDIAQAMKNHPSPSVRLRAPQLNVEAMMQDADAGRALQLLHRNSTPRYERQRFETMYRGSAPGGATATLKGIPGMRENLAAHLGTKDWDKIQDAVYAEQTHIKASLGDPTQVTPYAKITTALAAMNIVWNKGQLGRPLAKLTPVAAHYLTGGLGWVPESVPQRIKDLALKEAGLTADKPYVSAQDLPSRDEHVRKMLAERGYDDPTERDMVTATMIYYDPDTRTYPGVEHVIARREGRLKPSPRPQLPDYLRPETEIPEPDGQERQLATHVDSYKVAKAMGGIAALEEFASAVLELEKEPFYQDALAKFAPRTKKGEFAGLSKIENGIERADIGYFRYVLQEQMAQARLTVAEFMDALPARFSRRFRRNHADEVAQAANMIIADICRAKGATPGVIPKLDANSVRLAVRSNSETWQQFMQSKAVPAGVSAAMHMEHANPNRRVLELVFLESADVQARELTGVREIISKKTADGQTVVATLLSSPETAKANGRARGASGYFDTAASGRAKRNGHSHEVEQPVPQPAVDGNGNGRSHGKELIFPLHTDGTGDDIPIREDLTRLIIAAREKDEAAPAAPAA